MALYGRRSTPSERGGADILNQREVLNRTIRAQVSEIDEKNGLAILTYESVPSGGKYVTISPLWMSFPNDAVSSGPSWGRYMPQRSDLVRVAFDYDDRPYIVGYDIIANDPRVGDGLSGWPRLNTQYEAAKGNEDTQANRAKFAKFIPLNPGEYDFMSSGGAYIYGNNRGRLYMAGGSVSLSLIKNDLRMSSRAQLFTHNADDCELRFGQVRREINNIESPITGSETFKEFNVTLKNTAVAGTFTNLSSLKIGNVANDQGIPELSSIGQPLRYAYRGYNNGAETFSMTIDQLGNLDISGPSASTGFSLTSPKVYLGGSALTAVHPLFRTLQYQTAEVTFATNLAAQVTALSAQVTALAAGVATLSAGVVAASGLHLIPVAGPMLAAVPLGIAAAAGAAAGIAVGIASPLIGTAVTGVATGFTAPYSTYLSTTVFNTP